MLIHVLAVLAHLWLSAGNTTATAGSKAATKTPTTIKVAATTAYRVGSPTSGIYTESCEATIFCSKGDKYCGGASVYLNRKIKPDDVGVAHRTLPFGTKLKITNVRTGLSTEAKVIDRGPFGRISKRGNWYNGIKFYRKYHRKKKPIPTKIYSKGVTGWRGCLDVTPPVARAIKLNGLEVVDFKVIKWPTKYRGKKRKRKPNT